MVLAGLCGHVAYAYSQFCDPKEAEMFKDEADQNRGDMLIPYISVSELKHIPGMAGLYAAAVYAGTLSSLSGGINSNAAVILKNYIKPLMKMNGKELTAQVESKLSKILVLGIGGLTFCVSYIASLLGDSVLVAGLSSLGMLCGPCMGLFLLGILCPLADRVTATIAYILGHFVGVFLFLGLVFDKPQAYEKSPLYKEDCLCNVNANDIFITAQYENGTIYNTENYNTTAYPCLESRKILDFFGQDEPKRSILSQIWHVSYLHLGSSGCLTVFLGGWLIAIIRSKLLKIEPAKCENKYLHPLLRSPEVDGYQVPTSKRQEVEDELQNMM